MTSTELRAIFVSPEFRQELQELSSYLASIMQERPIVYLLAKCLWKRGYKFELENQGRDLFVNEKHIEFKFNYDRCEEVLKGELEKHGENLKAMWSGKVGNWAIMPKIFKDVCEKKPDIFVWIICSRDLSKVTDDALKSIRRGREQRKYSAKHPYNSDGEFLTTVDLSLDKLRAIRPFTLLKQDIETMGDFPSTYHFRICAFAS
jgi:hypothetical protein